MPFARTARILPVLLCLGLLAAPARGQGFGKNKVHYEPLTWAVLETPHLRLHYYAQEESLARRLAPVAERTCAEFDTLFRLAPRRPVPFLLFAAHHVFQQTNATPGLIPESTGGLTELIKGRVLVPHNGSWRRLVWVTRHELAHAYMLEKLARVMREHRRPLGHLPPLWFIEGLAEYCGTRWDEDAEGLLRDAVVSGRALPLTRSGPILGTVLMYKEGQSFLLWLAERYGRGKVFDLLDAWHRADDFETVFRLVIGRSLEECDAEWFDGLRRRYYPAVADADHAGRLLTRLTRRGDFNLGVRALPEPAPDSAGAPPAFCYFAAGEDGIELRVNEPAGAGRRRDRGVLRGGAAPAFESFHLFQNRPSVPRAGRLALSTKQGGRDVLVLLDGARHRVLRRIELPSLVAIVHPALAPDGEAIVFSAQDVGGRSDLYRVSWPGGTVRLERLTNDDFDDVEPAVSPDGRWVVFASDRGDATGRHRLWRLSLAGGVPEALGPSPAGDDRQPVVSPDGRWVAYRSTRAGTSDLWVRPLEPADDARRVTRLLGPAYDPDWLPDGRGLLFVGQDGVAFQVYDVRFDADTLAVERSAAPATAAHDGRVLGVPPPFAQPAAVFEEPASAYERRVALDIVQGGIALDPGISGGMAGGQVALSDVLGNEQWYILLANDAERYGDFLDGFQVGLTYLNQSQRLNYGIGGFRLTETYDVDLNALIREPRVGVSLLASYPFSKFLRLDGTLVARHARNHRLRNGDVRDLDLVSHYLSLVHDNARWTMNGPAGGTRWAAVAGYTRDLTGDDGSYGTAQFDLRRYARVVPGVVSATRVNAQAGFGPDAPRFYLGGYRALRGYDWRALSGTRTLLLQQELRAPLLRGLVLALPAPWELPTLNGAAWADAAWAWEEDAGGGLVPAPDGGFEVAGPGGWRRTARGSAGFGLFLGGGYFPALRWDFAWITQDFRTFTRRPGARFSILFNY